MPERQRLAGDRLLTEDLSHIEERLAEQSHGGRVSRRFGERRRNPSASPGQDANRPRERGDRAVLDVERRIVVAQKPMTAVRELQRLRGFAMARGPGQQERVAALGGQRRCVDDEVRIDTVEQQIQIMLVDLERGCDPRQERESLAVDADPVVFQANAGRSGGRAGAEPLVGGRQRQQ